MLNLTPAGQRHTGQFRPSNLVQVFVYWNLHRRCWSLRATHGVSKGKVIAHADLLMLTHVQPKVSEAGRRRVIAEGVKNVHAGLVGFVDMSDPAGMTRECAPSRCLSYIPTIHQSFVYGATGETYHGSYSAMMTAVNGRAGVKV